jgi:transposase
VLAENGERLSEGSVATTRKVMTHGTLIALTFVLTVEDRDRFQKSRDVGCYVGLRPKQSESGQSQKERRGGRLMEAATKGSG